MEEVIGCGDNSCIFGIIKQRGGMGTNGGCRCFKNLELNTDIVTYDKHIVPYSNRDDIARLLRAKMLLVKELREAKEQLKQLKGE
jgi:hypothetical protein